MKKVLIILRRLQFGGIEKATITLANALVEQGHDVHIWSLRGQALQHPDPRVTLHDSTDIERDSRTTLFGKLFNLINRIFLRVILPGTAFIWTGYMTSHLAKKRLSKLEGEYGRFDQIIIRGQGAFELLWNFYDSRAYIVVEGSMRSLGNYRLVQWLARCLFENKKVICVSKGISNMLEAITNRVDVHPASINIIHNGLSLGQVRDLAAHEMSPKILKPFLVHVSRLVPVKNQQLMIRAFHVADIPCDLVIIGDGSERDTLEKLVIELGISNKVHFLGHQENPYPWIARAKAFLISSHSEGLPTVVMESLICSTQVVATDIPGGLREILIEGQTSLISKADVLSMAEKIRQAFNSPLTMKPEWANRFDDQLVAKKYIALLDTNHES